MVDIHHIFTYKAPSQQIFDALTKETHIQKWWTPIARIKEGLNEEGRVEFDHDYVAWTIKDLDPPKVLILEVVDSKMHHVAEWTHTTLVFELEDNGDGTTTMKFSHKGWKEETECFQKCTEGWAFFLGDSLKSYLETGQGKPFRPGSNPSS